MGEGTKIEWCDSTWNPWWGCTRVSPACDHCYAETFAHRLGMDLWGKDSGRRFFGDKHWAQPVAWDQKAAAAGVRHRVFCASMADVFEARLELDEHRARLWALIESTPNLDWLLLTKRPEHVRDLVPSAWLDEVRLMNASVGHVATLSGWPRNAWVGTTVETDQFARVRLPRLARIPAPVRFVSYEPALGDVDFTPWLDHIDWVIVGGESGPGARPMDPAWVRRVRDDCAREGVAFLFKQMGSVWAKQLDASDGKGGALADIPAEFHIREFPEPRTCAAS